MFRLTLLCGIILVGLTLPLPDVAVEVVEVVSGDVANAIEREDVGLCRQSADQRQQPAHKHRGAGRRAAAAEEIQGSGASLPII